MEDHGKDEIENINVSAATVSSLQSAFNLATFTHSQISEQEKTNFEGSVVTSCYNDDQVHSHVQGFV